MSDNESSLAGSLTATTTDVPAASLMSKVSSLGTNTFSLVESSTTALGTSSSHTGASTQLVEPTKTASVWVDKPGLLPLYDVGLYAPNISSYGNSGNKTVGFECVNGCPLVIASTGYSELWCGVIESSTSSPPVQSYVKFESLATGNNYVSVPWINQCYVDWRNASLRYARGLFDSENGRSPIATSGLFEIHMDDWNYDVGRPQAVANGSVPGITTPKTIPKSPLSGSAKAGIAIAVILIVCIAIIAAFFFVRRRKRHQRCPKNRPDVHEKGIDNPLSKPELVGTMPADSGVPYRKPELEARTRILQSDISSPEGITLPYEGGTGAPAEPDREQAKQLVESERLIPHYMEVRESQTGEPSSPSAQTQTGEPPSPSIQREGEDNPTGTTTTQENLNTLKAQERELTHKMEVSESLLRLRAEHAALLDRIRIAEMREREVHAGG